MPLEAVLADEYTQEVVYERAYACDILDKKQTSAIVRELTTYLPIQQWLHLKRVKSDKNSSGTLSVLLAPCPPELPRDQAQYPTLRDLCPATALPSHDAFGPTFVVEVPKFAPLTREQFKTSSAVWPTTFHEDKNITRLLSGAILSETELILAESFMAETVRAAGRAPSHIKGISGCSDGCCIVDPVTNTILVSAPSLTMLHPLHHAVMVAIDLVARHQGGGAYKYPDDMVYLNCNSKNNAGVDNSATDDETAPYLCTGYDLYTIFEPCVLCAMALVHSRIRRVFYCHSSPDGALGTKYKIHVQSGLNHRYEVFRGLNPVKS